MAFHNCSIMTTTITTIIIRISPRFDFENSELESSSDTMVVSTDTPTTHPLPIHIYI